MKKRFLTAVLTLGFMLTCFAGCTVQTEGPTDNGKTYNLVYQCGFSAGGGP